MKFRKLAFILSIIMLLGILAGCTPKTQETGESYTLPNLETGTEQPPEQDTAAPDSETPGPETEQGRADPAESSEDPVTPESETAKAEEPLPPEPGTEERPTETNAQMADPDEDEEIESEYTFVIDDGFGVGGN